MKINYLIVLAIITLSVSCQSPNRVNDKSDELIYTLSAIQEQGILFGHQDDLAYGKNWQYIDGESDVKRVSGDYPAVYGWELGGLERGDLFNLDSVPFQKMSELAIKAHKMGGINSFSWHPYSLVNGENSWYTELSVVEHIIPSGKYHQQFIAQLDKLAQFFLQLKDSNGEALPIIFRPWHEMAGQWFWWGTKFTSPADYKALFRFTVHYLEGKGLTNMVICYSPNGGYQTAEEYLTWYPGDDIVDMFGLDEYEWPGAENWVENTQKYLNIMISVAQEKEKLAAFAETGCENLNDPQWFTQKLGAAIAPDSIAQNLCYVLVWRNSPTVHYFFPYEGHASEEDAKAFLADPKVYLLNDFNAKK